MDDGYQPQVWMGNANTISVLNISTDDSVQNEVMKFSPCSPSNFYGAVSVLKIVAAATKSTVSQLLLDKFDFYIDRTV